MMFGAGGTEMEGQEIHLSYRAIVCFVDVTIFSDNLN